MIGIPWIDSLIIALMSLSLARRKRLILPATRRYSRIHAARIGIIGNANNARRTSSKNSATSTAAMVRMPEIKLASTFTNSSRTASVSFVIRETIFPAGMLS